MNDVTFATVVAGVPILLVALSTFILSILNRRRVRVVHDLVNDRMTSTIKRMDKLELRLEAEGKATNAAGDEPPPPVGHGTPVKKKRKPVGNKETP